ncbi:hypothetical protein WG908_11235 [Sphingobium sp. AN641]|uniref:hypothetical protein n=1 Tax=Sphingobium sp. AN641 TaxID=3133443 RepID=UPI0030C2CC1F
MPPSPVHVRAVDDGAGGWSVGWTRRSRTGWRWIDGADVPMAEENELYAVEITDGSGAFRSAQVPVPAFHYDAAMRSADLAAGHGGPFSVRIRQMGAHAAGRWAVISLAA